MEDKIHINTVNIHGKEYVPVSERLKIANGELLSVETWIVSNTENEITIRAIVDIKGKGKFIGYASSDKKSSGIEGQSSIEVAETSALGRALGFAGYGVIDSIASAEEVKKAISKSVNSTSSNSTGKCEYCGTTNEYHKKGCPNER